VVIGGNCLAFVFGVHIYFERKKGAFCLWNPVINTVKKGGDP
jgi:hypothetical protein